MWLLLACASLRGFCVGLMSAREACAGLRGSGVSMCGLCWPVWLVLPVVLFVQALAGLMSQVRACVAVSGLMSTPVLWLVCHRLWLR